ncbi:MAG: hypothetical protein WDZ35_14455 [Crocinitomicaceae bacterium]
MSRSQIINIALFGLLLLLTPLLIYEGYQSVWYSSSFTFESIIYGILIFGIICIEIVRIILKKTKWYLLTFGISCLILQQSLQIYFKYEFKEHWKNTGSNVITLSENQGMSTLSVDLKENGEYIGHVGWVFTDMIYGTYEITDSRIILNETFDEKDWLCHSYVIVSKNNNKVAVPECDDSCELYAGHETLIYWSRNDYKNEE